jgi:hypothetical protein
LQVKDYVALFKKCYQVKFLQIAASNNLLDRVDPDLGAAIAAFEQLCQLLSIRGETSKWEDIYTRINHPRILRGFLVSWQQSVSSSGCERVSSDGDSTEGLRQS